MSALATAVAALLTAVVNVLVPVAPTPAGAASEAPVVVDRSPWAELGATFTIDLDLRAVAADAGVDVGSLRIRTRVHAPLDDVGELARSRVEDEGPVLFQRTQDVATSERPTPETVRVAFVVDADVNEGDVVRMAEPGVYPLVLSITTADGAPVGEVRTPVVLADPDAPRSAVVIADFTTPPDRPPSTPAGAPGEPDVTDPAETALPTATAARFERLLGLVGAVDGVTVAVDALTLARPGAEGLAEALATTAIPVVTGARTPTDVAATTAAGADDLLAASRGRALEDIAAAIGRPALADHWDAAAGVDLAGLSALAGRGTSVVILPSTAPPGGTGQSGGTAPAGGTTDGEPSLPAGPWPTEVADLAVLVVDPAASTSAMAPGEGPAPGHDLLAELVLRAAEVDAATLALRVDDVPVDSRLAAALGLFADDGPLPARGIGTAPHSTAPDGTAPDGTAPAGPEPSADALAALLTTPDPDDVGGLAEVGDRLRAASADAVSLTETWSSTPPTPDPAAAARRRVDVAIGAGLRSAERAVAAGSARAVLDAAFAAITLTGGTDVNLTSRRGTIPVVVENGTGAPLRVRVRVAADRLGFPDGAEQVLEVGAGVTRFDFPVEALATGSVPVAIELRTDDGRLILDQRRLNVRSTAFSGVGLAVSLGAITVLVVWWARTWRRQRRSIG